VVPTESSGPGPCSVQTAPYGAMATSMSLLPVARSSPIDLLSEQCLMMPLQGRGVKWALNTASLTWHLDPMSGTSRHGNISQHVMTASPHCPRTTRGHAASTAPLLSSRQSIGSTLCGVVGVGASIANSSLINWLPTHSFFGCVHCDPQSSCQLIAFRTLVKTQQQMSAATRGLGSHIQQCTIETIPNQLGIGCSVAFAQPHQQVTWTSPRLPLWWQCREAPAEWAMHVFRVVSKPG
jgi:hypothetical protein